MKKVFRERIVQLGAEANASEFARKCGLRQQDISRYLNHGSLPVSDKLAQIATSFNVTTDWLLGLSSSSPGVHAAPISPVPDETYWRELTSSQQATIHNLSCALAASRCPTTVPAGGTTATKPA